MMSREIPNNNEDKNVLTDNLILKEGEAAIPLYRLAH